MRKILLSLLALVISSRAFTQCGMPNPRHVIYGNLSTWPNTNGLFAEDSSGNFYTGAQISDYIDLGNNITDPGSGCVLAGYHNGIPFWLKRLSTVNQNLISDIQVDKKGNVFVTGGYRSNTIVDSKVVTGTALNIQAFVAKFDTTGNCQWIKTSSGNNTMNAVGDGDYGESVTPDENGGCFVSFWYNGYFTLGTHVISSSFNNTSRNSVIAHYDPNGNISWVRTVFSIDGHFEYPLLVDDNNSGAYMVLSLPYALCTLDSLTINGASSTNVFLVHVDSLGQYNWTSAIYNAGAHNAMRCLSDGTLLLGGSFRDSVYYANLVTHAIGVNGVYLASIDRFGNTQSLQLLAHGAGMNDQVQLAPDGLDIRPDGGVYISGYMLGTVFYGSTAISDQYGEHFAARFDTTSQLIWVRNFGGTAVSNIVTPYGIRTTPCGSAVVCGEYYQNFTISPAQMTAPGSLYDYFLAELDAADGSTLCVGMNENDPAVFNSFPNPASDHVDVFIPTFDKANFLVYTMTGNIVDVPVEYTDDRSYRFDISELVPGTYIISCNGQFLSRFIKS